MNVDVMSAVRTHLDLQFPGAELQVASVTFLGLEPIEVLRYSDDELVRYVTLGCARHPMSDPNTTVADPVRGPRAELVLTQRAGAGLPTGIHKGLALLAASPAVEGVVLQPDALIDLGEPLWVDSPFTAVLIADSDFPAVAFADDHPVDPVRFLEVVPITATEAAWIRLRGVPALREAWVEAGTDVRDPGRL